MPDSNNNIDYKEELFQKMRPLSPYTQRDLSECNDTFDDKVIEGWYSAREFVLEQLSKDKNMGAEGFLLLRPITYMSLFITQSQWLCLLLDKWRW